MNQRTRRRACLIYVPTRYAEFSELRAAYLAGHRSQEAAMQLSNNPHPANSWESKAWIDGWKKAAVRAEKGSAE